MNDGPIIIADDDIDDKDFLQEAWQELNFGNELIFFSRVEEVMEYMASGKKTPFIILSDVNLGGKTGFELKEKLLHSSSNYASIPFIYWSAGMSLTQIEKAYDLGANGFFIKDNNLLALKQTLIDIVKYWKKCIVPR